MAYVTAGQLYEYVTAILHRSQPEVQVNSPFWRTIIARAWSDSYGFIVRGLVSRGYGSASQVPAWDDGANFQMAIGAFLALEAGGCLGAFDDKFLLTLDRREELQHIQVTIGGVWQTPDGTGGSPLPTGAGQLNQLNDPFEVFGNFTGQYSQDNPQPPGRPTQW